MNMLTALQQSIWQQFGASIDTLRQAIEHCPPAHWDTEHRFWYHAYHTLFFLDYYLTLDAKTFAPPAPFDFSEFEDRLPARTYTPEELLTYLQYCRRKCRQLIDDLTEETAFAQWTNQSGTMSMPVTELLLYNMRHVQHHAAQLNLLLRQLINDAPRWVLSAQAD